jgi:hypothetical protein
MHIVTMFGRPARFAAASLAAALAAVLAAGLILGPAQAALAAPDGSAQASASAGWVRLAHLSPNTPPVDVYLYSFGDPSSQPVLHHVAYGNVSAFQQVPAGLYGVAMRPAGAALSTMPVVSGSVKIVAGDAYTVAALGPASGLRLSVFTDPQSTPAGSALVQVIQASLKQNTISVTAGGAQLATALAFGKATTFVTAPAGSWPVRATGLTEAASTQVSLQAGTVHTFVVLDGQHGLTIDNIMDAAASAVMPKSGVRTGFGGAAAVPGAPLLPWATVGLTGLALVGVGMVLASRRQPDAQ